MPIRQWTVDGERVFTAEYLADTAREVTQAAYKVIAGKGATNSAIGLSGARIVEALLRSENAVLPVSTVPDGQYGISGVALSLPSIVGTAESARFWIRPWTTANWPPCTTRPRHYGRAWRRWGSRRPPSQLTRQCDLCHILSVNLSDSRTAGQPLARLSAAEAVFNVLRSEIESGKLVVGAKLSSEATLAQQYGVSRSVVREALRSCTALGLTVTRTGRGTFVVADHVAKDLVLGQYSARDLTEARPHIEVPAAGLAAERRSPEELDTMRDVVAAMTAEDDPEVWVGLDSSFHALIARASRNKVFENVVSDIREALAHQSETLNMVADRQHASDEEHRRILAAIEAGDAATARIAMSQHLHAVGLALDSILNAPAGA